MSQVPNIKDYDHLRGQRARVGDYPLNEAGGGGTFDGGDGGGTFDDMEARVRALETGIGEIKLLLARMDERMSTFATKSDVAEIKGILASKADAKDISRVEGALASKVDYKWFCAFFVGLSALIMREEIMAFLHAPPIP